MKKRFWRFEIKIYYCAYSFQMLWQILSGRYILLGKLFRYYLGSIGLTFIVLVELLKKLFEQCCFEPRVPRLDRFLIQFKTTLHQKVGIFSGKIYLLCFLKSNTFFFIQHLNSYKILYEKSDWLQIFPS